MQTLLLVTLTVLAAADSLPELFSHVGGDVQQHMQTDVCGAAGLHGYQCSEHQVRTADGYELTMQRVGRQGPQGRPVLLQHGLLDSAFTWLSNLPQQSLAFVLADRGFDVWLANSRGSRYSRRHVTFTADQERFWRWSFDQLAAFDVPACVHHVLQVTGQRKLSWIGHSQGSLIAFAALTDPALTPFVNVLVALAPVARVTYTEKSLRSLAPFASTEEAAMFFFGLKGEVLQDSESALHMSRPLCGIPAVCLEMVSALASQLSSKLNKTRIPVYFSHTPAGTSARNIVHYAQLITQGRFQKYDGGIWSNLRTYSSLRPPEYDLKNVTVPVALFWSEQDSLASAKDTQWMISELPNVVLSRRVDTYKHLDFVWATDANQLIYNDLAQILDRFSQD